MTSTDQRPSVPTSEDDDVRRFLGLSPTQIAGGALAAVTSALAASFFGVGGTLVGAALGSIVSTVGGALYAHSFDRANRTLRSTRVRLVRSATAPPYGHPGPTDPTGMPSDLDSDARVLADAAGPTDVVERGEQPQHQPVSRREALAAAGRSAGALRRWTPNWRTLIAVTAVFFVIGVAAITLTEVVLGHPVSNASQSGTSVTQVLGGGTRKAHTTPTPAPSQAPSTQPSGAASEPASPSPTTDPAQSPTSDASPGVGSPAPVASDPTVAPSAVAPISPADAAAVPSPAAS